MGEGHWLLCEVGDREMGWVGKGAVGGGGDASCVAGVSA